MECQDCCWVEVNLATLTYWDTTRFYILVTLSHGVIGFHHFQMGYEAFTIYTWGNTFSPVSNGGNRFSPLSNVGNWVSLISNEGSKFSPLSYGGKRFSTPSHRGNAFSPFSCGV